jgi:peptidoglycan/xylan/chitin deacetylase (PgdA/CDA1 family)
LLYDTTGYFPSIYRFPGGSSSSSVMKEDVSMFINYLNQKSVVYFDWNVVSGDATGVNYTSDELYENVINGVKLHSRSIVLVHDTDTKANTVTSLKRVLKTLTEHGAEILPLNENVTPIQQVKANSIKQKK